MGIASYNIFVGIYIATIFGAGFFFDLFFPARWEPTNIRWWWRGCAVFACMLVTGDAIGFTIIVSTHRATITANTQDAAAIAVEHIGPPLRYWANGRAIASVVFLWIGFVGTYARSVVFLSRDLWC